MFQHHNYTYAPWDIQGEYYVKKILSISLTWLVVYSLVIIL